MKPVRIEVDEWQYNGCIIQKTEHPALFGKYSVFKNNKHQSDVGRCYTFAEAKLLCEKASCKKAAHNPLK